MNPYVTEMAPGAHEDLDGRAHEAARPTPRLILAPSRGQELTGVLGGLAKLYLLDVNGTSLLTRRAAMEMKLIAVMLTINFLFDLAVWTLLWNMVFYAGKLSFGVLTVLALFCGFLFASIIFVYERQFMTADTYRRWHKVWWPVSLRLAVIAMAAAITTQPFEVMIFSGPIQRRIHEESVRLEALSRLRALEEAQAKTQGAIGLAGTIEEKQYTDATQQGTQTRVKTNRFKAEAESARADLQRAEAAVSRAAAQRAHARTAAQAAAASRRIAAAQARAEQARAAISEAEANAGSSAAEEKHWEQKEQDAEQDIKNKQQLAEKDVKRLQDWITQLRNARPGEAVTENTDQPSKWQFQDADYDFFQRLSVINDLYFGRPPRWFEATPEIRKRLSELFKLNDPDEQDTVTQQRGRADAHTFVWSYWAVIGIAAVIPLLLLALKGLLPIDLKHYYSLSSQQAAGNYEALRFHFADGLTASYAHGGEARNGYRAQAPAGRVLE